MRGPLCRSLGPVSPSMPPRASRIDITCRRRATSLRFHWAQRTAFQFVVLEIVHRGEGPRRTRGASGSNSKSGPPRPGANPSSHSADPAYSRRPCPSGAAGTSPRTSPSSSLACCGIPACPASGVSQRPTRRHQNDGPPRPARARHASLPAKAPGCLDPFRARRTGLRADSPCAGEGVEA
jgi:hypothetical protein